MKMMFEICTCILLIGWQFVQSSSVVTSKQALKSDEKHNTSNQVGAWKDSNYLNIKTGIKNGNKEKLDLVDSHHSLTKRESLTNNLDINFYTKLIKELQELVDREQDFFPEEKRYFGRYRSSNHLIKSLAGMKPVDRYSAIAKHFGLTRSKRSTVNLQDNYDGKSIRKEEEMMGIFRNMAKLPSLTGEAGQSKDETQRNPGKMLGKRFFGRTRNSNYIWEQQRKGHDVRDLLKNHWKINWSKRPFQNTDSGRDNVNELKSPIRQLPSLAKRFQVDLDYSYLWSLMMNKNNDVAQKALQMYMNP